MSGFKHTLQQGVRLHTGDPHCDAAHASLLAGLTKLKANFIGPNESISISQKGNLGEYICVHIALKTAELSGTEPFIHNAIRPLSRISGAGVDMMYVHFDPADEGKDCLFIQEVKTTSQSTLSYLDALSGDYEKLFGTDPDLTLQTRIDGLENSFELERRRPDYAERVSRLRGTTPQECSNITLIPTGVHLPNIGNPTQKLLAIKSKIVNYGWKPQSIAPWSVALSDLQSRLTRLARGQT